MSSEVKEQEISSNKLTENEINIIRLVEYYFGKLHLSRSKRFRKQAEDNDGWIPLESLLKQKIKLAKLSENSQVIMNTLKNSKLIEIDEANEKIRRSPDYPIEDSEGHEWQSEKSKRTVHVDGFPYYLEITTDEIEKNLEQYGPFQAIHILRFDHMALKKYWGFESSVLIEFPTVEKAEEFINIENVNYEGESLTRIWLAEFEARKKEEKEIRKGVINGLQFVKKLKLQPHELKFNFGIPTPVPQETFLYIEGFPRRTTVKEVKVALSEYTDDVASIDINRKRTGAYIQLSTPFSNEALHKRLDNNLKINGKNIKVYMVNSETEAAQLKKMRDAKIKVEIEKLRVRECLKNWEIFITKPRSCI